MNAPYGSFPSVFRKTLSLEARYVCQVLGSLLPQERACYFLGCATRLELCIAERYDGFEAVREAMEALWRMWDAIREPNIFSLRCSDDLPHSDDHDSLEVLAVHTFVANIQFAERSLTSAIGESEVEQSFAVFVASALCDSTGYTDLGDRRLDAEGSARVMTNPKVSRELQFRRADLASLCGSLTVSDKIERIRAEARKNRWTCEGLFFTPESN